MVDQLCLEVEKTRQILAFGRGNRQGDNVLHDLVDHLDRVEGWVTEEF